MSDGKPTYRALDGEKAVRFLKLLPGSPGDELFIELFHDGLGVLPPIQYEALSYTWGSPIPTRSLICNGDEIELRQNAYEFLARLRLPNKSRVLWMDCLCIDQSNLDERAQQVRIMHLIYRSAERVLVWLGPQSYDSDVAMKYVLHTDPQKGLDEFKRYKFGSDALFKSKSFLFNDLTESPGNLGLVTAFANLLQRPWFRRIWIQQETVMCRDVKVFCGQQEVIWDQLFSLTWLLQPADSMGWPLWTDCNYFHRVEKSVIAAGRIQTNRISILREQNPAALDSFVPGHTADRSNIRSELEQAAVDDATKTGPGVFLFLKFTIMIADCSWCEATDPRDKIYALLNMLNLTSYEKATIPKIDYTVPWQTVYVRYAKWMLSRPWDWTMEKTLEMAGRVVQSKPKLPSWVPDWREGIENAFVQHTGWSAGGKAYLPNTRFITLPRPKLNNTSLPAYFYIDGKGRKKKLAAEGLELTAILLDKIVYTSPRLPSISEWRKGIGAKIQQKMATDLQAIRQHIPQYFTGELGVEAFAGTLIANTDHTDNLASDDYEREGFALWQLWLDKGAPKGQEPVYDAAMDNAESLHKYPFCLTAHDLMCLTPHIAGIGDYVAIMSGFRLPTTLRRVSTSEQGFYELLGPCYMHRMMRGRAWSLIEEFKCKYRPKSEDENFDEQQEQLRNNPGEEGPCEGFPFNPKADYRHIIRVLGKKRIVLV